MGCNCGKKKTRAEPRPAPVPPAASGWLTPKPPATPPAKERNER